MAEQNELLMVSDLLAFQGPEHFSAAPRAVYSLVGITADMWVAGVFRIRRQGWGVLYVLRVWGKRPALPEGRQVAGGCRWSARLG